jgi:hypothetical protein
MDSNASGFAMADGTLQFLEIDDEEEDERTKQIRDEILESMDPHMVETLRKLAATYPDVAVWEMKSLTVGDEDVMVGLKRAASTGRPFNWATCLCDGNLHKRDRMAAVEGTRAGPDAPSTPWTSPDVYEEFSQSVYASDGGAASGNEDDARDTGEGTSTLKASPPATVLADEDAASILTGVSDAEREVESPKDELAEGMVNDPGSSKKSGKRPAKSPTKRKRRDDRHTSAASVNAETFIQQVRGTALDSVTVLDPTTHVVCYISGVGTGCAH